MLRKIIEAFKVCRIAIDHACKVGDSGWAVYHGFRKARVALDVAEPLLVPEVCIWVYQPEKYGSHDYWETSCGNASQITNGTPTENEMKFCSYCGRQLKEKKEQT